VKCSVRRQEFAYFCDMIRIHEGSAPDFKNKSQAIAAEVTTLDDGAGGGAVRSMRPSTLLRLGTPMLEDYGDRNALMPSLDAEEVCRFTRTPT
jgi:hypothetical protein